jgi:hypothetical protein
MDDALEWKHHNEWRHLQCNRPAADALLRNLDGDRRPPALRAQLIDPRGRVRVDAEE